MSFSFLGFLSCHHSFSRDFTEAKPVLELGASVNFETGFYEKNHDDCMADFHFYEVNPGDSLCFDAKDFEYQLAFYNAEIDEKYIYTYCYSQEENWATFTKNLNDAGWKSKNHKFNSHGWARIIVRRKNSTAVTENDRAYVSEKILLKRRTVPYQEKPYFTQEISTTAGKVNSLKNADTVVLGLLTDSHYVINGHWEDTAYNLLSVHEKSPFDALVHLGDFTDGMTPFAITKEYFKIQYDDMKKLGVPLYLVLGNHDSNYFKGNPESMSVDEQSRLYLQNTLPYYYVDFAEKQLRMIFLYSFDHTQVGQNNRYGFPSEEIEWMKGVLDSTPDGYKVLVFSHVPLLASMHFWSDEIRNSGEMISLLDKFNTGGGMHKGRILAFIHGHVHSDWVNTSDLSFPVISIGCAKIEDEQVKKAAGSTTYHRKLNDVTQELWNVLVVNTRTGRLDFVRFGAGEDRGVINNF